MNDDVELTGRQIRQLTGLTPAQVKFWTNGKVLSIKPDVAKAQQGKTSLHSLGSYYLICLAREAAIGKLATFSAIGAAVDAIGINKDWPRWEQNRGRIFASIYLDKSVRLVYSPRVQPGTRIWDCNGELEYEGLLRALTQLGGRSGYAEQIESAFFLSAAPDFPNTERSVNAIAERLKQGTKATFDVPPDFMPERQQRTAVAKKDRDNVCTVLVFDLYSILGDADQKLQKLLG